MKSNTINRVEKLLDFSFSNNEKYEIINDKIREILNEYNIELYRTNFYKDYFEIQVELDNWKLDDIVKFANIFNNYFTMNFYFDGRLVWFQFKMVEDKIIEPLNFCKVSGNG